MALQMKMQMKLNQQLIMTPQLQQAIKLLQLSHTELEELIEQTLVENPVLEEGMDIDSFPNRETPVAEENPETPEVASGTEDFESAREVEKEEIDQQDIDWQQYVEQVDQLGGYQSTRIRPGTGGDDEAPSLEATLAQSETLSDHLHWQMGMQDLLPLEFKIGVELIGNLEDDGYLVTSIREMLETRRDLHDEILNQLNEGLINCNLEVDESFFDLKYNPVKAVMPKKSKEVVPPVFDEEEEG
ncbi:MAG: RNA polymerase sigma-54 factor, partial [SAR324 cluster bacterium]|nr:RNA polymerase sigma-54 factor [SAR324 cluster bacterium]